MDDITQQRYRPSLGGIVDTRTPRPTQTGTPARLFPREYSVTETMDTVRWLNERNAGYPTMAVGANRA